MLSSTLRPSDDPHASAAAFGARSRIDPAPVDAEWAGAAESAHQHAVVAHKQMHWSGEADGSGSDAGMVCGDSMTADGRVSQSISELRSWQREEADVRAQHPRPHTGKATWAA